MASCPIIHGCGTRSAYGCGVALLILGRIALRFRCEISADCMLMQAERKYVASASMNRLRCVDACLERLLPGFCQSSTTVRTLFLRTGHATVERRQKKAGTENDQGLLQRVKRSLRALQHWMPWGPWVSRQRRTALAGLRPTT